MKAANLQKTGHKVLKHCVAQGIRLEVGFFAPKIGVNFGTCHCDNRFSTVGVQLPGHFVAVDRSHTTPSKSGKYRKVRKFICRPLCCGSMIYPVDV